MNRLAWSAALCAWIALSVFAWYLGIAWLLGYRKPSDLTGYENLEARISEVCSVDDDGDEPRPVLRVSPHYPSLATYIGQEGWVTVAFDVNAEGTVENARFVDEYPPYVFRTASISAVRDWRYCPLDTRFPGVLVTLTFELVD